jgi:hypothetical protein
MKRRSVSTVRRLRRSQGTTEGEGRISTRLKYLPDRQAALQGLTIGAAMSAVVEGHTQLLQRWREYCYSPIKYL